MRIDKAHCLFEQSGTFKNAFRNLGIEAYDYDIADDFGETDYKLDLFSEIEKALLTGNFLDVGKNDLVFAFFPCTRFEARVPLLFRGEAAQQKNWSDMDKLVYSIGLHEELHKLYDLLCKLMILSIRGGWKLVVENPATPPHYLTTYFPIKPKIIHKDRTLEGDYYKKPTQYWFVNCEPEHNFIFEPLEYVETHTIDNAQKMDGDMSRQVKRSLMHPQYADRFIRQYLIGGNDESSTQNRG